jgi:predicted DNA-binding transcriptional regulator YafY
MRADRLLSILMILQRRGKSTAETLARELEVSVRTVYRDVLALSSAGVPVYTEKGPGGGIRLVETYRSNLTGLTREQVRALFMLSSPTPLSDLGLDKELQAAMLKLSASLPRVLQDDERRTQQRFHLDPGPWEKPPTQSQAASPALSTLQRAVWDSRIVEVAYHSLAGPDTAPLAARLLPYGLVAKGGRWYLVAKRAAHTLVLGMQRVVHVQVLEESFEVPEDFDLAAFWQTWCSEQVQDLGLYRVVVRVREELAEHLPQLLSEGVRFFSRNAPPRVDGAWRRMELAFDSHDEARAKLLQFGAAVEVLEPLALQYSVLDYAQQICQLYGWNCYAKESTLR